jgi:hypothetical protein
MIVIFVIDIKTDSYKHCIKVFDSGNLEEPLYTVIYQTQTERLYASIRAQRICQQLGWRIESFQDACDIKSQWHNRVKSHLGKL